MKRTLLVSLVGLTLVAGFFAWTFKGRSSVSVSAGLNDSELSCIRPASVDCVTAPSTTDSLAVSSQLPTAEPLKAAYLPPEVSCFELRKLVDRRCSTEERVYGSTTGAILDVKDERDLKALVQVLSDPEEDETVRHEIANVLFRSEFAGLEAALFRIVENPTEKSLFRGWAVQHLGKVLASGRSADASTALIERIRPLLTDRHIEVRREAWLALVSHGDAKALDQVVPWLKAEGPKADPMRDLAIRCAKEKDMRDQIPTIRRYIRSTNESVRISAIWLLGKWGDEESRLAFEEAASSPRPRLQSAGKLALANLNASAGKK